MSRKVYALYKNIGAEEVIGFRYVGTFEGDDYLPPLESMDILHVVEEELDWMASTVRACDGEGTYFLFEVEGDDEMVSGECQLTVIGPCSDDEEAMAAAADEMFYDSHFYIRVFTHQAAMIVFDKLADNYVPYPFESYRRH